MFKRQGLFFIVFIIAHLNAAVVLSARAIYTHDLEQQQSAAAPSRRLNLDFNHRLLRYYPYPDISSEDEDAATYHKRGLIETWAKLLKKSQSPYAIAFPSLLRSRRSTQKEQ
jgi:hypothetical protein